MKDIVTRNLDRVLAGSMTLFFSGLVILGNWDIVTALFTAFESGGGMVALVIIGLFFGIFVPLVWWGCLSLIDYLLKYFGYYTEEQSYVMGYILSKSIRHTSKPRTTFYVVKIRVAGQKKSYTVSKSAYDCYQVDTTIRMCQTTVRQAGRYVRTYYTIA